MEIGDCLQRALGLRLHHVDLLLEHAQPVADHHHLVEEGLDGDVLRLELRDHAGRADDFAWLELPMQPTDVGGVDLAFHPLRPVRTLQPAGHILGSAQVVLDYRGQRAVITGDITQIDLPPGRISGLVEAISVLFEQKFGEGR